MLNHICHSCAGGDGIDPNPRWSVFDGSCLREAVNSAFGGTVSTQARIAL